MPVHSLDFQVVRQVFTVPVHFLEVVRHDIFWGGAKGTDMRYLPYEYGRLRS